MNDRDFLLDKAIREIEAWGILTLMSKLSAELFFKREQDRKIMIDYQLGPYKGSELEAYDKITAAIQKKYDEEFAKIYKQKEDEYEASKS